MYVSHRTKEPLTRLYRILEPPKRPRKVSTGSEHATPLSQLVYDDAHSADSIKADLANLPNPTTWATALALLETTSKISREDGLGGIVYLSMIVAGDVEFRLFRKLNAFPYQLLWLVYSDFSISCPHRQRVCRAIVSQPLDYRGKPERNAIILRDVWADDIN